MGYRQQKSVNLQPEVKSNLVVVAVPTMTPVITVKTATIVLARERIFKASITKQQNTEDLKHNI
jgi:hypothetical protein